MVWGRFRLDIQEGHRKKNFKLFFVASKNSTARSSGCGGLVSSSKSPHGQGAFFEPLHKKPSPRQGPRRVGVRASHGQSSLRYPFGVSSTTGGREEFYSFSCRRPQKLYSVGRGQDSGPVLNTRGAQKKKFKLFFVASKNSTARSAGAGGLLSSSKSPHGQGAFFEPLHKKPSPRQGPRRVGVRASHGQSSLRYP